MSEYATLHPFVLNCTVNLTPMTLFWIFLALVLIVVVGNAMTLLRTARKPEIPAGVKPQPYSDDD